MKFALCLSALIFVACACSSPSEIPYDVDMTVTPIGSSQDGEPQQYLLESSYVEPSRGPEAPRVMMPKLIAVEGQKATAFVGKNNVGGDTGTMCEMLVTRREDRAEVALCFRSIENGEETRRVRQLIAVPVSIRGQR